MARRPSWALIPVPVCPPRHSCSVSTRVSRPRSTPATGVNSITQCVSGQCGQVIEGNSQLKPEVAKTWSLGLSVSPHALPGFSASVDYYHIRLENEIGNYPFATILNGCLFNNN